MGLMTLLAVCLAGGLGAVGRYVLDSLIRSRINPVIPLSTLVINVMGSALFGFCLSYAVPDGMVSAVVMTGFCGGFTTFSSAMAEAVTGLRAGDMRSVLLVLVAMVIACCGAAWIGMVVGAGVR